MNNRVLEVVSADCVRFNGRDYRCAIGKNGFVAQGDKREGDLCTPTGLYTLRELWVREDKVKVPETVLPIRIIQPDDGWCDDASHADYNRHVTLPFDGRHEKLWRDDDCYDLMIPLGYNDDPPIAGRGSAIFLHVAKPDFSGTEGCVALAKHDVLEILPRLSTRCTIVINPS